MHMTFLYNRDVLQEKVLGIFGFSWEIEEFECLKVPNRDALIYL